MGNAASAGPAIELYGDEDDHLRLVALAAGQLAHLDARAAAICRRAERNPWSERLEAFETLVRRIPRGAAALRVRDPDALFVGPLDDRRRWDDTWFAAQRSAMLSLLVEEAAERGAIGFERPYPRPGVTRRIVGARPSQATLPHLDLREHGGGPFEQPGDMAAVARWLLEEGVLEEDDLDQLIALRRPGDVLTAAWEHLPPSARQDAATLSSVRYPIPVNGAAGPFAWASAVRPCETAEVCLSRTSVDTLVRACDQEPTPPASRCRAPSGGSSPSTRDCSIPAASPVVERAILPGVRVLRIEPLDHRMENLPSASSPRSSGASRRPATWRA